MFGLATQGKGRKEGKERVKVRMNKEVEETET